MPQAPPVVHWRECWWATKDLTSLRTFPQALLHGRTTLATAEQLLLQDRAYAAYLRLNSAILACGEERWQLLEEHEVFTGYVVKALEQDELRPDG